MKNQDLNSMSHENGRLLPKIPNASSDLESFAARLKTIIASESLRSFAERSGVSVTVLRQYLAGHSDPARAKLIAMANAGGVSVQWLATGEGPMSPVEKHQDDPYRRSLDGYPEIGVYDMLNSVEIVTEMLDGKPLHPHLMREMVQLCSEILADEAKKTDDTVKARSAGINRVRRVLNLVRTEEKEPCL
ncbi:MAG: helix-turn-helix transcriptional regulator [Magnetococcales bacterium]|nr:helix-turn-helix transcriptional regulator [Magnetococcales bacterium]